MSPQRFSHNQVYFGPQKAKNRISEQSTVGLPRWGASCMVSHKGIAASIYSYYDFYMRYSQH